MAFCSARRRAVAALGLLAVAMFAGDASAQIRYTLTGTSVGTGDLRLDDSSLFTINTTSSTNGSFDVDAPGPIFRQYDEVFGGIAYADVREFGYFGLRSQYDGDGNPTSRQFVVAARPGTAAGQSFSTLFADYLAAHPAITGLADFIAVIDAGPDEPTPGGNVAWIDFQSYLFDQTTGANYQANILTTFQLGEPLDLIAFDNGTGVGADVGDLQLSAIEIPEPAVATALVAALACVGRRPRRHSRA